MKNILYSLLIAIMVLLAMACTKTKQIDITPMPTQVTLDEGSGFKLSETNAVAIAAPTEDAERLARYISENVKSLTISTDADAKIRLAIVDTIPGIDSPEGYALKVTADSITIDATMGAGLFYGVQSLVQLIDGAEGHKIPACTIIDEPRFEYRGILFDVSRHFRDKEFIKKQIDAMAALKLNTLHFHLTDAAGWRLEIEKYPRLTEFAAWRDGETWKEWNQGGNKYLEKTDSAAHGGYYTKDDIRELVAYAADRYITIIPEIEMPSHSEEVLAAYPELSCQGKPYTSSDFCPGNEATFKFIEDVLDEVMELFPSKYINVGGDEAPKGEWRKCPKCQRRMAQEGLTDVDQLQSYLIHRVERYLNEHGRDLIGWDEIMEGGLAPNAAVVSWRGVTGGIEAARQGHKAVMAPGKYCYFDGYQDAPSTQPEAIGGYLPLEMVYGFNPAPDSLDAATAKYIIGVEATVFAEYIPTAEHFEYMLYPRMLALAETAWTPDAKKDYADFHRRALTYNDRLAAKGYNVFDLRNEAGNRKESVDTLKHIGFGKPVTYNVPWWKNYPAAEGATLTDGLRGGWSYNDLRWQGFNTDTRDRLDVTIDLEDVRDITFVGADFMQICNPDVWMPAQVIITASTDGKNYEELATINYKVVRDEGLSFKTFAWLGEAKARYIRYQALADHGILFTDEIVIK